MSGMTLHRIKLSRIIGIVALTALLITTNFQRSAAGELQREIPSDLSIKLERTRCYGFCPSYLLTISAAGKVTFEGRHSVKVIGPAQSSITREKLAELVRGFDDINYFGLQNAYETPNDGCKDWVTDGPTAITSLTINGRSKSVRHYSGCRGIAVLKDLEKLEQAIDEATNVTQWVR